MLLMVQKSQTTTWDVQNPVNNGINYLLTGAGFLPSTVLYGIYLMRVALKTLRDVSNISAPNLGKTYFLSPRSQFKFRKFRTQNSTGMDVCVCVAHLKHTSVNVYSIYCSYDSGQISSRPNSWLGWEFPQNGGLGSGNLSKMPKPFNSLGKRS